MVSHVNFPSDILGEPGLEHSFAKVGKIVHSSWTCYED